MQMENQKRLRDLERQDKQSYYKPHFGPEESDEVVENMRKKKAND